VLYHLTHSTTPTYLFFIACVKVITVFRICYYLTIPPPRLETPKGRISQSLGSRTNIVNYFHRKINPKLFVYFTLKK
jgi:hypothetical protein